VIDAANPAAYHRVSGSSEPITQRRIRNAYCLPFSRRLDIEYSMPSDRPRMIIRKQLMELLALHGEAEVRR